MRVQPPADGLIGLAPVVPRDSFGKMPNQKHQTAVGFMTGAPYSLAIVEFDDQGRCYDRAQMDGVADKLTALVQQQQDVVLLVFVHGWKHDARSDDENLSAFRVLLAKTVEHERLVATSGATVRPVLGIFVGWRGLSEYGLADLVSDATFQGRQAAGRRVATGSVRELFGRLRHYRNDRVDRQGSPLLVIAGHSFGGMIVYSALAQSLVEAASAPADAVVPRFADLVLLINPAIEAERYIPIQDLVDSAAFKARSQPQLPVFICAQAENDQPVGTWFPIANIAHRFDQDTIGSLEKECVTRGLGFVHSFRTHHLGGPQGEDPFSLDPPGSDQLNPFWMVGADKPVIDGHGGIWQQPFLLFLASIIFQHVRASQEPAAAQISLFQSVQPAAGARRGNLATFARSIGEIHLPQA